ncbi:MAG: hypothetical protein WCG03_08845 [Kiritimatiellales bacterium]
MGDRVPMFKLRPYRSLLVAVFFVAVIGGLISVYFFTDEAYLAGSHRGYFALSVTLILTLFLIVAAFSRYCFPHLRHHRHGYKRG